MDKFIKNKKTMVMFLIIVFLVILDQTIKLIIDKNLYNNSVTIINGVLNLTYVENTGGAYGIGSNSIISFIIVNIIVISLLTKFVLYKKDELNTRTLISVLLIISGGIGNLIDRVFRGHVIDYLDINPLIKYPVFNMADVFIVFGCAIIIINLVIDTVKNRNI